MNRHFTSINKLEWDSNFFDFPIARAYFTDEGIDTRHIDTFCRDHAIVLVQTCVPAGSARVIDALQAWAFRFIDLRFTFETKLCRQPARKPESVEFACLEDIDELKALIPSLFSSSRYYTCELTRAKADDFYKIWIENAVRGVFDDFCILHRMRGKIAGFVTARLRGSEARIGLIGVSPKMHNKGIGSRLVKKLIHVLGSRNMDTLRVVTQGANTAGMNFYIKSGFTVESIEMWLYKVTGRKE